MISRKASKASIPKGALDEQNPSQQPYWDVAQALITQSRFQTGNLISQLLFILSVTFMEKFISFSVEANIFILLVWVAQKYRTQGGVAAGKQ